MYKIKIKINLFEKVMNLFIVRYYKYILSIKLELVEINHALGCCVCTVPQYSIYMFSLLWACEDVFILHNVYGMMIYYVLKSVCNV